MPKLKAKISGKGNAALTAELLCKTRLCVFHAQGTCSRGDACTFAHGSTEIATRPDFSRTQVCRTFKTSGHCAKGDACLFAHNVGSLKKWGRWAPEVEKESPNHDAGPRWTSLDSLGVPPPPGGGSPGGSPGRPRRNAQPPGGGSPCRPTAGRPAAWPAEPPPGIHKPYDYRFAEGTASMGTASMSTTSGTTSMSMASVGTASMSGASMDRSGSPEAVALAMEAVRRWQERGHVPEIAGPPGLIACERYRSGNFNHGASPVWLSEEWVDPDESTPRDGDDRDEEAFPQEIMYPQNEHRFQEFPHLPPQTPPPPPGRWLGGPRP